MSPWALARPTSFSMTVRASPGLRPRTRCGGPPCREPSLRPPPQQIANSRVSSRILRSSKAKTPILRRQHASAPDAR